MLPFEGYLIPRVVGAAMLIVAVLVFLTILFRKVRLLFLGRPENRFDNMRERFRDFFTMVAGQSRVVREPTSGLGHALIFWGLIVFIIKNIPIVLSPLWPGASVPFFTDRAWFVLLFDVVILLGFVALAYAVVWHFLFKPRKGITRGFKPDFILFAAGIMGTHVAIDGWLIATGADGGLGAWMPLGLIAASIYEALGLTGTEIGDYLFAASWWGHLAMVLAFFALAPTKKHLHMIFCPFNEFFHNLKPVGGVRDQDVESEQIQHFGYTRMDELTWKGLLDALACVECGRCQENCPAYNTDKPLSPKEVIQGLQEVLIEDGKRLRKLKGYYDEENIESLVDRTDGLSYDSIWSCTNCGACVEHCPISIEHVDKILGIRRAMVLNEGRIPHEVGPTITGVMRRNNPWNLPEKERLDWADGLDVPTLADKPDAEYLYWVGCISSYDERSTKVARAFATLLNKAGVDFAVLGAEEGCCAESFRRIGAEDLFKEKNAANIEKFKEYGVKKLVTSCPHCYNTFKNEYPDLGFEFDEVIHHTDLLAGFITDGQLKPERPVDMSVTFHDSCFLGRFNGIYETPRAIVRAIPGAALQEMDKNYSKSFCCGAGGGRMWMEEDIGKRINLDRVQQALATEPDCITAGCAYCMNMFDDALKEEGAEDVVKFMDVAELLAESVE
jgi:Fe-S oxidoreductase